jgi:hypothetical protein
VAFGVGEQGGSVPHAIAREFPMHPALFSIVIAALTYAACVDRRELAYAGALPAESSSILHDAESPAASSQPRTLSYRLALGEGSWAIVGRLQATAPLGPKARYAAQIEALGIRADFQHDAAKDTTAVFVAFTMPLTAELRHFRFS